MSLHVKPRSLVPPRKFLPGSAAALCALAAFALLSPQRGNAQVTAIGTVKDSSGIPLAGATVTSTATGQSAISNERGEFRLAGLVAGDELKARRLGFSPSTRKLSPTQSQNEVDFRLGAIPRLLNPVVVSSSKPEYKGRLAGYYQRLERRSNGYFISRELIDKRSTGSLSQLLKSAPGVNSIGIRGGGRGIRMRGRGCRPLVWLDGVPMPAGEVDLDAFPTSTLHGIELYLGSTNAPSDFTLNGGFSSCGTIILWSRGKDTESARSASKRPIDLERMIESLKIFSADQVDTPASLSSSSALDIEYPPELYSTSVSGSVLAEFVVDTTGSVEQETVSIVASTHPLFSAATIKALQNTRFTPAVKGGVRVRQVVQQPFSFVPGQRKSAGTH